MTAETEFYDRHTCTQCGRDFRKSVCGFGHALIQGSPTRHKDWPAFVTERMTKRAMRAALCEIATALGESYSVANPLNLLQSRIGAALDKSVAEITWAQTSTEEAAR